MPFNIWCLGCNNHVAMGVRFNADKRKVGMYYTTPLFEFRMKCHLCTNHFVIRTDPKNFDYELVEGCRRQENRFDPSTVDNLGPVDRTLNLRLSADAMYKAEHVADDKKQASSADAQIERLEAIQSRLFDDYGANSYLRSQFRREKKDLSESRARDEDMKSRLSTGISLLPESADDRLAAERMLKYRNLQGGSSSSEEANDPALVRERLLSAPIFPVDPLGGGGTLSSSKNNNKNKGTAGGESSLSTTGTTKAETKKLAATNVLLGQLQKSRNGSNGGNGNGKGLLTGMGNNNGLQKKSSMAAGSGTSRLLAGAIIVPRRQQQKVPPKEEKTSPEIVCIKEETDEGIDEDEETSSTKAMASFFPGDGVLGKTPKNEEEEESAVISL